MAIIAVPGGTGNIGRTIVDALLATGKHQVKILSRKANPELEAEIGAPIIAVDYSDVDALVRVLEDNNIDTIVSGIAMHSLDGTAPHEIEIIRAADRSKTTKRLISSGWGVPHSEDQVGSIPSTIHKLNAHNELLKVKDLQYTIFHVGYLADYWGIPAIPSYMGRVPLVYWIDMANEAASIPGSGDTPVVFTHTTDIAKYVAASLDLPKWEPETFVYGDRVTWNEFLKLAEEAKGTKFKVVHDSKEKLKLGQTTELPGQIPLYQFAPKEMLQGMGAVFGLWFEDGMFDLKPAKFLNETFPKIKPMTIKAMLDKAWKKQ